jgi:hypothetical protein
VKPPGEYVVQVEKYNIKETKDVNPETGKKGSYINWELTITEGEYKGKKLFHMTSLSEKATGLLKSFLEPCGVEIADDNSFDPDEAIGAQIKVVVAHEDYDGQPREKIKRIL